MNLIFLFGMPGVGKLTVARELSNLTGFKVFHNHLTVDLVTSVFEFGSVPFIELREKIWLEIFSQALQANILGLIFTFAFDQTVSNNFPNEVRNLVENKGGKVFFIELKCSNAELENRLANHSRQGFGKLTSIEFFRQLDAQGIFNSPKISADFAIETTELSAAQTAQMIVNKLKLA